ncbi:hypothetical protein ACFVSU_12965 [Microbacterium sp. NPDC058062]|uniref:hypothetical protein n=1 Tax=Microbacterium sp. NPDC058062 TaxID=3346320 RepID=UPI0036D87D1C
MDNLTEAAPHTRSSTPSRSRSVWRTVWPAALGVLVAAATVYRVDDGRDVAPVVAASGLVYLAAAATGRPWMAWAAFGVTLPLITIDKFTEFSATPWILALALVLLIVGLATRANRPSDGMLLQTTAMLLLGATAVVAILLDARIGGLVVAAALLAHAAWDLHHLRARRVVDRSLALFCAVLDILVACFVAIVSVTA